VRMALCLVNGGASTNLGLKDLRVQEKEGRTDTRSGLGRPAWADLPRPIPARFGRPFTPVGPYVFMHFSPSICTILMISSLLVEIGPEGWTPTQQPPELFPSLRQLPRGYYYN
jgi:hypothetical protein